MNPYRHRIWEQISQLLENSPPHVKALDFGSGDGWFATQFAQSDFVSEVVPVDVLKRENSLVEPILYDGQTLPFPDNHFDLVYAIDVLHHCPNPKQQLRDLLRTCGGTLLLKDHSYSTPLGKLTLCALDEIGNRKFGVPSIYRYQHGWEWFRVLEDAGFELQTHISPCEVHIGALGKLTNSLQFISLWSRVSNPKSRFTPLRAR